jgi:hypothetical protein
MRKAERNMKFRKTKIRAGPRRQESKTHRVQVQIKRDHSPMQSILNLVKPLKLICLQQHERPCVLLFQVKESVSEQLPSTWGCPIGGLENLYQFSSNEPAAEAASGIPMTLRGKVRTCQGLIDSDNINGTHPSMDCAKDPIDDLRFDIPGPPKQARLHPPRYIGGQDDFVQAT